MEKDNLENKEEQKSEVSKPKIIKLWPIIGVVVFVSLMQILYLVGTCVAVQHSLEKGSTVMLWAAIIQVVAIIFGIFALKNSKDKAKAILLFVLLCILVAATLVGAIFWKTNI